MNYYAGPWDQEAHTKIDVEDLGVNILLCVVQILYSRVESGCRKMSSRDVGKILRLESFLVDLFGAVSIYLSSYRFRLVVH